MYLALSDYVLLDPPNDFGVCFGELAIELPAPRAALIAVIFFAPKSAWAFPGTTHRFQLVAATT